MNVSALLCNEISMKQEIMKFFCIETEKYIDLYFSNEMCVVLNLI